jgi:hypothetical protein
METIRTEMRAFSTWREYAQRLVTMYTEMKILCNEMERYAELEPCTVQQCENDAVPDVKYG